MKRYTFPDRWGQLCESGTIQPAKRGEYVPAEVAERLYRALKALTAESNSYADDATLLDAILASQAALKFADEYGGGSDGK